MTTSKGSTFNRRKGVRFHPSLTDQEFADLDLW